MLNSLNTAFLQSPVRQIRGHYLAFNKLKPRERAKLAADIVDGRIGIIGLTVRQAARLCRVGRASVTDARKPASEALLKTWTDAAPEQRRQFIGAVGTESIWDELVTLL